MMVAGVPPNNHTFNTVIKASDNAGDYGTALDMFFFGRPSTAVSMATSPPAAAASATRSGAARESPESRRPRASQPSIRNVL